MKEFKYYEGVKGFYSLSLNKSQRTLTFVIVADAGAQSGDDGLELVVAVEGSKTAIHYVTQIPHKEIRKVCCLW